MILLTFLLQTIRIAIPYLLAAAGGVMSERVGIIALGLEGMMLAGAFGAALGSYYGGSPWIGLAGALAAGAMVTADGAMKQGDKHDTTTTKGHEAGA